jgi:hypothetical protein
MPPEQPRKRDDDIDPFKVTLTDGRTVVCDPRSLTFADRRDIKREIRQIADDDDDLDELMMPALAWVHLRRDGHPDTLEDVCGLLTVGAVADGIRESEQDPSDPEA